MKSVKKLKPAAKCCKYCQDYGYCKTKGKCCKYCDHYFKSMCTYEKDVERLRDYDKVELPDYRGDDYGIDDYEEYEEDFE